jgi:hypothetical protein
MIHVKITEAILLSVNAHHATTASAASPSDRADCACLLQQFTCVPFFSRGWRTRIVSCMRQCGCFSAMARLRFPFKSQHRGCAVYIRVSFPA